MKLGSYASAEDSLRKVVARAPGRSEPVAGARGAVLAHRSHRAGHRDARSSAAPRARQSRRCCGSRRGESRRRQHRQGRAVLRAGKRAGQGQHGEQGSPGPGQVRRRRYRAGVQGPRVAVRRRPVAIPGRPRVDRRASAPRRIRPGAGRGRHAGKKAAEQSADLQRQGRGVRRHARQQECARQLREGAGGAARIFRRSAQPRAARRAGTEARRRAQALRGDAGKDPKNEQVLLGLAELLVMSGRQPGRSQGDDRPRDCRGAEIGPAASGADQLLRQSARRQGGARRRQGGAGRLSRRHAGAGSGRCRAACRRTDRRGAGDLQAAGAAAAAERIGVAATCRRRRSRRRTTTPQSRRCAR